MINSDITTYAGIPEENANFETSQVLLQSIPYDGTSSWGKGADKGFDAFGGLLPIWNCMTLRQIQRCIKVGVHTLPSITEESSPENVFKAVYNEAKKNIALGKFYTVLVVSTL